MVHIKMKEMHQNDYLFYHRAEISCQIEVKVALDFVILVAKNTEVSIDELVYIEIDRKAVHVLAEGGCHEHL